MPHVFGEGDYRFVRVFDDHGTPLAQFTSTSTGLKQVFTRTEIEHEIPTAGDRHGRLLRNIRTVMDCMTGVREAREEYRKAKVSHAADLRPFDDKVEGCLEDLATARKNLGLSAARAKQGERVQ